MYHQKFPVSNKYSEYAKKQNCQPIFMGKKSKETVFECLRYWILEISPFKIVIKNMFKELKKALKNNYKKVCSNQSTEIPNKGKK